MLIKVKGLRDGVGTAGSNLLIRQIRALGATVTLARTGRVTIVTASGERRVYTTVDPINTLTRDQLARVEAASNGNSPLTAALADLAKGGAS